MNCPSQERPPDQIWLAANASKAKSAKKISVINRSGPEQPVAIKWAKGHSGAIGKMGSTV
ncbi:MAG TPA: hypothetical protein VHG71_09950 [Verrucomicrobiae bacterium]|nr:hypothetical protein [Verrucomicrobiae bacterium]